MLDVRPSTNLFTVQETSYFYLRHHLNIGNSIKDIPKQPTVESIKKGIISN